MFDLKAANLPERTRHIYQTIGIEQSYRPEYMAANERQPQIPSSSRR